jgi:hypothetical protein
MDNHTPKNHSDVSDTCSEAAHRLTTIMLILRKHSCSDQSDEDAGHYDITILDELLEDVRDALRNAARVYGATPAAEVTR